MSNPPKQKLLTFQSGGWVLLLSGILCLLAAGLVLLPVWRAGGFHRAIGDGRNIDTYGFDLSNLTIPREDLVASGNPKDQIRAIPENLVETITPDQVKLIAANEHIRFLVPADRVIGIVLSGTARAYPLRVLNLHEIVNDTLAGTPLAVSYSPLCDSALVFDRRIDGPASPAVEFGNSGLLYNSNAVFFNRHDGDLKSESLWPQLHLAAISGPHAGKPLTLIPYQLVTYEQWTTAHPDTRILLGLRSFKTEYGSEPYNTYLASDDLKFPAHPLWPSASPFPKKTPITVTSTDLKSWTASPTPPTPTTTATAPTTTPTQPPYQIHTFLFAWYAQHPADTNYSAFGMPTR